MNNNIKLNGEDYTLGTPAISIGINMACKKVISKCSINSDSNGLYILSGGIKIKLNENDLNDYYVDNSSNRKLLKSKI